MTDETPEYPRPMYQPTYDSFLVFLLVKAGGFRRSFKAVGKVVRSTKKIQEQVSGVSIANL